MSQTGGNYDVLTFSQGKNLWKLILLSCALKFLRILIKLKLVSQPAEGNFLFLFLGSNKRETRCSLHRLKGNSLGQFISDDG